MWLPEKCFQEKLGNKKKENGIEGGGGGGGGSGTILLFRSITRAGGSPEGQSMETKPEIY